MTYSLYDMTSHSWIRSDVIDVGGLTRHWHWCDQPSSHWLRRWLSHQHRWCDCSGLSIVRDVLESWHQCLQAHLIESLTIDELHSRRSTHLHHVIVLDCRFARWQSRRWARWIRCGGNLTCNCGRVIGRKQGRSTGRIEVITWGGQCRPQTEVKMVLLMVKQMASNSNWQSEPDSGPWSGWVVSGKPLVLGFHTTV